jgi:hypothetical protein
MDACQKTETLFSHRRAPTRTSLKLQNKPETGRSKTFIFCIHTHTFTHAFTHTLTLTHTHTHTYVYTHAQTLTHTHSHIRSHTRAQTLTHTLTHTFTHHTLTHTFTHTFTHSHSHTYTLTRTHSHINTHSGVINIQLNYCSLNTINSYISINDMRVINPHQDAIKGPSYTLFNYKYFFQRRTRDVKHSTTRATQDTAVCQER